MQASKVLVEHFGNLDRPLAYSQKTGPSTEERRVLCVKSERCLRYKSTEWAVALWAPADDEGDKGQHELGRSDGATEP